MIASNGAISANSTRAWPRSPRRVIRPPSGPTPIRVIPLRRETHPSDRNRFVIPKKRRDPARRRGLVTSIRGGLGRGAGTVVQRGVLQALGDARERALDAAL